MFINFAKLVKNQFDAISQSELYAVDIGDDDIFQVYLNAFPDGTNPIFRERTEHDCSCCKQFIRRVGNVVGINGDQIVSVWDVQADDHYAQVAKALSEYVKSKAIKGIFRVKDSRIGTESNIELLDGNKTQRWHHFYSDIDRKHRSNQPDTEIGHARSSFDVLKRGLTELKLGAINDVVDLVHANALYRGQEHLERLQQFRQILIKYDQTDVYVWKHINSPAARFRNTSIGTLIQDISEGVELERAVKSFEAKVAPQNYKRPTALITPRMVESAMDTIRELDLEPALQRRHAKITDVNVNDVLFVDASVQNKMKGGVEALLMEEAVSRPVTSNDARKIAIQQFVDEILPKAQSIELLVQNRHEANFASLTAPVHEYVKPLFKWENNFGWSYDGNVTDSIRDRVKKAGGNVDAHMRFSLSWFNYDDLDIHVHEPSGDHIYFQNKANKLDVDMNAGGRDTRDPVENVSYTKPLARDGDYKILVNNYSKRESVDVGFVVEIVVGNDLLTLSYDKPVRDGQSIHVVTVSVVNGRLQGTLIGDHIKSGAASKEVWGVNTEVYTPVKTIMKSPNHWNGCSTGNLHWFFIMDCKNPNNPRGIYNEFLRPDLEKHRKVFEILGDKTKCQESDDQLSGVGFSSTRNDTVTALVKGDISGHFEITF